MEPRELLMSKRKYSGCEYMPFPLQYIYSKGRKNLLSGKYMISLSVQKPRGTTDMFTATDVCDLLQIPLPVLLGRAGFSGSGCPAQDG